jgi:hypothetical protein
VFIAIEVSKRGWLIAGHTPCDGQYPNRSRLHSVGIGDLL